MLVVKRMIYKTLHNSQTGVFQWLFSTGQGSKNCSFLWKNEIVCNCSDIILITLNYNSMKNEIQINRISHWAFIFSVGLTIFLMKRMLWVYWSTINDKNGQLNLTKGRKEWGRKFVPVICSLCAVLMNLHRVLWAAYSEIQQELLYVEDVVWNDSN